MWCRCLVEPSSQQDAVLDVNRPIAFVEFEERAASLCRHRPDGPSGRDTRRSAGSPSLASRRQDAKDLRRVIIGFRAVEVDDVVAQVGEFLREAQLRLAALQLLFGQLARR